MVSKVVSSDACAQGWEHPRKRYWLRDWSLATCLIVFFCASEGVVQSLLLLARRCDSRELWNQFCFDPLFNDGRRKGYASGCSCINRMLISSWLRIRRCNIHQFDQPPPTHTIPISISTAIARSSTPVTNRIKPRCSSLYRFTDSGCIPNVIASPSASTGKITPRLYTPR